MINKKLEEAAQKEAWDNFDGDDYAYHGFIAGAKWAYENPKRKLVVCEDCKKVSDWDGLTSSCTCGCGKFKELEQ